MTSTIAELIRSGALVPVQVFGSCGHPDPSPGWPNATCDEGEHFSFGLCDRFSTHTPGGSDCNRAEFYLLRPNDLAYEGCGFSVPCEASEKPHPFCPRIHHQLTGERVLTITARRHRRST